MLKKYTVIITPQAQEQIQQIINYIIFSIKAPDAAFRLMDLIENKINTLDSFPERIAVIENEPWHSQGLRKLSAKNYFIYFWIDEKQSAVIVTAVIYNKRDQKRQLANMQFN